MCHIFKEHHHMIQNNTFLMIHCSKVLQVFLLLSLYFSSLNLKYLKLTKMVITRFAVKLYSYLKPLNMIIPVDQFVLFYL